MSELINIGVIGAFWGGIVSFFSPCTLPIIPGYISYLSGQHNQKVEVSRFKIVNLSLFFVLGFSIVFISLGVSSTFLGRFMTEFRYEFSVIGGAFIILLGLFMTGIFNMHWLQKEKRFYPQLVGGTPIAALLLGMFFSFGWTPCIGPVLAAILTYSTAASDPSIAITYLSAYSLGLGIPFILASIFIEQFTQHLPIFSRYSHYFRIITGVILIVIGMVMMTGQLTSISIWLLSAFSSI